MGQSPFEAFRRIQQNLQQQQKRFSGGGGGPRGGLGAAASLLLVGGAVWTFNNALFNGMASVLCMKIILLILCSVDGGHRAIKYTRIGGVRSDIYSEGTFFA